jgi:hypothetical protein
LVPAEYGEIVSLAAFGICKTTQPRFASQLCDPQNLAAALPIVKPIRRLRANRQRSGTVVVDTSLINTWNRGNETTPASNIKAQQTRATL